MNQLRVRFLHSDSPVTIAEPVLASAWPHVKRWLDAALDNEFSLLTSTDLFHAIANGKMALRVVHIERVMVAAYVTEVVTGGRGSALNVIALGGKRLREWIDPLRKAWDAEARDNRCRMIVFMGRRGWRRIFAPYGYVAGPPTTVRML